MMEELFIEIIIMLANIKDYFFGFMDPVDVITNIEPFSEALGMKGQLWLKKIKHAAPSLDVFFVGSAALALPGHKDLDYVISCEPNNFYKYTSKLNKLLGKPSKVTSKSIEWKAVDGGVSVDAILLSKNSRLFKRFVNNPIILKKYRHLYEEYKNLKLTMNGRSYRSYEFERNKFFNKLFYRYGSGLDFIFKHRRQS